MERTLGKCPVGLINELAHSLSLSRTYIQTYTTCQCEVNNPKPQDLRKGITKAGEVMAIHENNERKTNILYCKYPHPV